MILDALKMEAARTSETLIYFYEAAQHYVPESCHLITRRSENLKFHKTLKA
jgi:hypothetical protein